MKWITDHARHRTSLDELLTSRIHYGCGKRILKGWLNVDGYDESYPDGTIDKSISRKIFCMNIADRHPFDDNYFTYGFSEDFIEHLTQSESLIFLEEAFRTLAPGGVLRLSCPGLEGVLQRHYKTITFAAFSDGKRDAYDLWTHKHFYCRASLELVARHIGFKEVRFVQYGESLHEALRGLDSRPDQKDLNLYAELLK